MANGNQPAHGRLPIITGKSYFQDGTHLISDKQPGSYRVKSQVPQTRIWLLGATPISSDLICHILPGTFSAKVKVPMFQEWSQVNQDDQLTYSPLSPRGGFQLSFLQVDTVTYKT